MTGGAGTTFGAEYLAPRKCTRCGKFAPTNARHYCEECFKWVRDNRPKKETADCCPDGAMIGWHPRDITYGPEKDGWSIDFGGIDGGDLRSVVACPFCGKMLA